MNVVHLIGVCIAAVACCIDVRQHRIPNWLTFGAAAAGLIFHTLASGGSGFAGALLGWATGAAIFFLPFALGGLGAGDVKLIAALGAWFVWPDALWFGLFTGIAGGVVAVAVALARGYLGCAIDNVRLLLAERLRRTGSRRPRTWACTWAMRCRHQRGHSCSSAR